MFEPQCILLADGDSSHAAIIREVLQSQRISNNVQTVRDFAETIAYLSGDGRFADRAEYPLPCFLLLDLNLAGAFDALKWIREHPEFRRLPVVVLAQSVDSEHLARIYALGANSCLVKPFDQEKLRELVKSINAYWVILCQKPSFPQ